MRYEVGVGGLLVVAGAVTGLMAVDVGDFGFEDAIEVTVPMADASGLAAGASVRVAGVDVGTVSDLFLAGDQAMVSLELEPAARLRRNVRAQLRQESLVGAKYIELVVTSDDPEAPLLQDGDVLPPTGDHLDFDEFIALVGQLVESVDPEHMGGALQSLTDALGEDPERLVRILSNLDEASQNAVLASRDFPALTGDLRVTLAGARSSMRRIEARTNEVGHVLARADRVLGHLEAGVAPIPDAVLEAQAVLADTRTAVQHLDAAAQRVDAAAAASEEREVDLEAVERLLREEGIKVRLERRRRDK